MSVQHAAPSLLTAASAIMRPSWPPPRTPTTAVRGRPASLRVHAPPPKAVVHMGTWIHTGRMSVKCRKEGPATTAEGMYLSRRMGCRMQKRQRGCLPTCMRAWHAAFAAEQLRLPHRSHVLGRRGRSGCHRNHPLLAPAAAAPSVRAGLLVGIPQHVWHLHRVDDFCRTPLHLGATPVG
jgi:hypothetical protein